MDFKLSTTFLSHFISGIMFFILQVTSNSLNNDGCVINSKHDMTQQNSLILYNNKLTGKIDFLQPENNDINIDFGDELILACPGSSFKEIDNLKIQKVQCLGDNFFGIGEEKHKFNYYTCKEPPKVFLKKLGKCTEDDNIIHYKIGFELDNEEFLELIDLYFNKKTLRPMYTTHNITKNINTDEVSEKLIEKRTTQYFEKISLNNVYNEDQQKKKLDIYVTPTISKKFIDGKHFLTNGNLVPIEDFPYLAQQKATSFDVLTAPQFRSFKNGNWKTLEDAIRKLANNRKIDLTVYTGVYGELNITGKPLHMARHKLGYNVIPVPTIFWKIVQHNDKSIVFIGYNNPFSGRYLDPAKQICSSSFCDKIGWVKFENDSLKGNIYCCEYQSIKAKLNVPVITSTDILY